ncbi:2-methylene-furan-3-one reductase [Apiospora saccharicola]
MERRTTKSSSTVATAGGLPKKTMRALGARKYTPMSGLEILEVPVPEIQEPGQMLIKMHAAGLATGDAKIIAGKMKMMVGSKLQAGIVGSGVVVQVGSGVTAFRPGDAVYGMAFGRPLRFNPHPGYASEYAIGREDFFLPKPAALSFEAAAAAFGSTLTAYQSIELGLRLLREQGVPDGLEGKTVFVPGALSATGNVGVLGEDVLPFWFLWVASLAQLYYRWRLRGTGIQWGIVSGNAGVREDVARVGEILATGKIRPVMTVVEMEDVEAVREAADKVQKIKGGIGGLVIKIA